MTLVDQRPADNEARAGAGEVAHGDIETRLRAALREAMITRDVVATFALRSALSAIGNAGAVPAPAGPVTPAATPYLAGSATGLGAGEAPRRGLTQAGLAGIVRAEAAERETAAGRYEHAGQPDRAGTLRREAAILRAALGER